MLSHFSHVRLFVTLWTVACQPPLSVGLSGQEYWSGLPCPPPGDLPDPGIKPMSLASPALAGRFFTTSTTWEHVKVAQSYLTLCNPIQSMGFSRPDYWSELPFSFPGDLPNPGIEPRSPTLQADYLPAELPEKPT